MAMNKFSPRHLVLLLAVFVIACSPENREPPEAGAASAATIAANARLYEELDIDDQDDWQAARRGLIAQAQPLLVKGEDGRVIWDMTQYQFIDGNAPATVNPSLWRQAGLNNIHGLFKVSEGIHQLRGFDLANMTLVDGESGWIVIDPLTARETAAAAMDFARSHLGEREVSAVVFTHSHIDHFGGVLGVISEEQLAADTIPIIAPEGFLEEATSENILAGPTMARRSGFMYGQALPRSATGHVGSGLGKSPAYGTAGIVEPNLIVQQRGQREFIDGVEFVFQDAGGSEAPAELTFYLPGHKAFCGAEVVSRNMHNLYTLRGAKVRDALKWSNVIDEALFLFPEAEVYFGSHHWPVWGQEKVAGFLKTQRDTYKYIHDQTLRMAASGATPGEIAEQLRMPESLARTFSSRGYYGTVRHNARAVYQAYFGWYDGNPANLNPLPPEQAASRYVDMMGGSEQILAQASRDFEQGEYRWVAEILNHLVFAQPDNQAARELLARTYEQLGYQAESGPWRDVYLTGALELRQGPSDSAISLADAAEMMKLTPVARFLDAMAVMLNGERAEGEDMVINLEFTDLGQNYVLVVENAVLRHYQRAPAADANASIRLTHDLFMDMLLGQAGIRSTLFSDELEFDGSELALLKFFSLLDPPQAGFAIVEP